MTEQVRSPLEGRDSARDGADQMREDLLQVARLEDEPVRRISAALSARDGMLSPEDIGEIVREHLSGDVAEAASRLIVNIAPDEIPSALGSLENWYRLHPSEPDTPSKSILSMIRTTLSLLIQDYPALRLMHKAQRVLRETGNEFQSIIYVCDLRPVYDDEHTEVVAFVPLVNMQIGYLRQNGGADFFELALTADEVQHIIDLGQDALKKLRILESMIDVTSETDELE